MAPLLASALKPEQRGDAPDAQPPGGGRVRVRVQLENERSPQLRPGELVERGSHHPARSAPVRVAIDHHGNACSLDHTIEVRVGHLDRPVADVELMPQYSLGGASRNGESQYRP